MLRGHLSRRTWHSHRWIAFAGLLAFLALSVSPPGGEDINDSNNTAGSEASSDRRAVKRRGIDPLQQRRIRAEERSWRRARKLAGLAAVDERGTPALVAQAQAGDEIAFAELYLAYFDRIFSYVEACLRHRQDAEDLAQQIVVRVIEALPAYKRGAEPFAAWLFSIVRNQTIDHLRRKDRFHPEAPEQIGRRQENERPSTADDRETGSFGARLTPLIKLLPKQHQRVLVLRYLFDLTPLETAAALGCSVDTVRQRQHRALKFLESRLDPDHRGRVRKLLTDV